MALEIERKFLVDLEYAAKLIGGNRIKQGYIDTVGLITVRARIKGKQAYLTIKGPSTDDGMSRSEFEYEIPHGDAEHIIESMCTGRVIDKTRYEIIHSGKTWEVDVFHGPNSGLVMAEIELDAADEKVEVPGWVLKEVTGDIRYYNSRLTEFPWSTWQGSGA